MGSQGADQGPIIGREGLLRLVKVVERLRSREQEEGASSWTTEGAAAPDARGGTGDGAVGEPAGGEPSRGGALAGGDGDGEAAGGTCPGDDGAGDDRGGR